MTSPPTDLFLNLTPERVLAAVEAGGLECNNLCYSLNSFENRVYEVELLSGTRIVAKFYRPERWTRAQILEEHQFLAELDAAEIPVCPMRPFPDESTLKQIDRIQYCLAERRAGRAPDELNAATARRLGMLVARLHNVGASRPCEHRRPLDADQFIRRPVEWLEQNRSLPPALEARYFRAALDIAERADRLLAGVDRHRIHADLHLGNVLFRDGLLRVLDFDDMAIGPAVQDVWLALPGRDHDSLSLRRSFIHGYEQFRLFDRDSLRLVEVLRGLRLVRYAAWLARRWHDPAFRQGWPHFGTTEYWDSETRDLEEQLEVIRRQASAGDLGDGGEDVHDGDEEQVLENKDYFWDWEAN
jgi:Ser/Thr protein kinase RdoA (MazF antagonist)